MANASKQSKPVKDFSAFTVVEVFKKDAKPLTGADPVILSFIKKAAGK